MKHTLIALTCSTALLASAHAADITVEFTGITDVSGELYVAVYPSATAMKQHAAIQSQVVAVHSPTPRIVLADLPEGHYGIMVFQDLDGNRDLNSNMLGIPTEPYGFSTNPQVMGPPSFEDIRFDVTASNQVITISME